MIKPFQNRLGTDKALDNKSNRKTKFYCLSLYHSQVLPALIKCCNQTEKQLRSIINLWIQCISAKSFLRSEAIVEAYFKDPFMLINITKLKFQ